MAATTITRFRLHLLSLRQHGQHRFLIDLPGDSKCLSRHASSKTSTKPETSKEDDILGPDRRLDFDAESLAARGYLRNQKPYTPPSGIETRIMQLCRKYMKGESKFFDAATKFNILSQCAQSLQHTVPNSLIHRITNIDELIAFYKTPVNTTIPLDMMKDMDLPKNLHVIYKYHRFHPETDTKFGGVTAFSRDSTLVTGLKYKKKYPSFINKTPFSVMY